MNIAMAMHPKIAIDSPPNAHYIFFGELMLFPLRIHGIKLITHA